MNNRQNYMDTNEQDFIESQDDAEITENEVEESYDEPQDDVDELKKQIASLEAQKKHWRDKADKPKEQPEVKAEPTSELEELRKELAKTQLMAQGFNNDEQSVILTAAKELGISPLEASQKRFVTAAIEEIRESKRVENATPSPTSRGESKSKGVEHYLEKDEMPDDPEMVRAMIAKLSGKTYKPLPK